LDSGTHLVFGLGLAGLSYIDPIVAADPAIATAVLIGTVIGSQAPDADSLLRLRNNAVYIRNHRGISHSLPALLVWTVLITFGLSLLFTGLPLLHVGGWVFLAVSLHVFTDLFNTYGTQAFRPFTEKWVSWNIIHIFDPIIFISHIAALLLWITNAASPQVIFPVLYGLLINYYLWRTWVHYGVTHRLPKQDTGYKKGDRYYALPTANLFQWNIVKQIKSGGYQLGELKNDTLLWIDQTQSSEHPAVEVSKKHPDISSFLYHSTFASAEVKEHAWGYEVRWVDVRYRHRKQYPFVAVQLLDKDFQTLDSYVGWLSESRLDKKLRVDTY
jgi:inner membrane protein